MQPHTPSTPKPKTFQCHPLSLDAIVNFPENPLKISQQKLCTEMYINSSVSSRKKTPSMNKIKTMVSKKKNRFTYDEFDLDLTYITPRIIAMGLPSSNIEGLFRNSMDDVRKFFQQRHPEHHKVYNLCDEKNYNTKLFHKQANYPFHDHEAPPLHIILPFCEDAKAFLDEHPKNVVAVHCLAGKGRTGTFISCLLRYLNMFNSATECLKYFGVMRVNNGKGVTVPSQIRYVYYFESLLVNKVYHGIDYGKGVMINKVKMITVPNFGKINAHCRPVFTIMNGNNNVFKWEEKEVYSVDDSKVSVIEFDVKGKGGINVKGDVRVCFEHLNSIGNKEIMFKFWFNTMFIEDNGVYKLEKSLIDLAVKDKECKKFKENFAVEIEYEFM